MAELSDDKSEHCLQLIFEQLGACKEQQVKANNIKPLFVGINGAQGIGKTSLVRYLTLFSREKLRSGTMMHKIPEQITNQ